MSFILATKGRASSPESKATQGILSVGGIFEILRAVAGFAREVVIRGFTREKVVRGFDRESVE